MAVPDFPNKGKFIVRDKHGNRTGEFADAPQYNGQQPRRYPAEWTPLQCFMERTSGENPSV